MKDVKSSLKLVGFILVGVLALNFAVMYVVFGVNIFQPMDRSSLTGQGNSAYIGYSGPGAAYDAALKDSSQPAPTGTGNAALQADTSQGGGGDAGDSWYMAPGEVECLADLSLPDKIAGLSLITKIGREDADRIYDIAGDGITNNEMEEIKSILEKKLSPGEMETVYRLLDKNRQIYAGRIN